MAASPSQDSRASSVAERFQLLRELGSITTPVWAALDSSLTARARLVVLQRVSRGGAYDDLEVGDFARDAGRLATLEHPNVARVRDVVTCGPDVLVVSDFIDGVRWSEIASSAQPPPLEVALRVLIDVLAGLGALHNLRDANRQPLKLVHGQLTPRRVLVGIDGVTRVVGANRIRAADIEGAASAYLAPEVLLADDAADARADVYSVGVMLWEAISGRPLFANASASAIATQILSGQVPRATLQGVGPWAAPLVDTAARAISAAPDKRFVSTAAFAAELRRIAGPKLAQSTRLAAFVRTTHGDQVRARREALERGECGPRGDASVVESLSDRISIDVPIEVTFELDEHPSSAPTPVPPAPTAPTNPAAAALAAPLPPPRLPALSARVVPGAPTGPPPLPVAALIVPLAPRVPKDLSLAMGDARFGSPARVRAPSSPPSAPALATTAQESLPGHPSKPRRAAAVAVFVGVSLAATALGWRLASRTPARETPQAPSALAASRPEPQPATSIVVPTVESEGPNVAATSSTDLTAAGTAPTSPTAIRPSAPQATSWPAPAAPAPARQVAREKYDPQGI